MHEGSGDRPPGRQRGGEIPPALPTTGEDDAAVQTNEDAAEVRLPFAGENTAFARVRCSIGERDFVDFLTLVRVAGVTDLLLEVLDKAPSRTFVVIDEVEMEDWGVAGLPVDEFRKTLTDRG